MYVCIHRVPVEYAEHLVGSSTMPSPAVAGIVLSVAAGVFLLICIIVDDHLKQHLRTRTRNPTVLRLPSGARRRLWAWACCVCVCVRPPLRTCACTRIAVADPMVRFCSPRVADRAAPKPWHAETRLKIGTWHRDRLLCRWASSKAWCGTCTACDLSSSPSRSSRALCCMPASQAIPHTPRACRFDWRSVWGRAKRGAWGSTPRLSLSEGAGLLRCAPL